MKRQNIILISFATAFILMILTSAGVAMNIFKNDFEKRWEVLSSDVEKLNSYTKLHPVELRNVKIEGKNLGGVIFNAATFDGVEWVNTNLEEGVFTKVVFKNCKFINTQNWNSTFTDVLFENCTFHNAEFSGSSMVDVSFKGCKITDSRLKELFGNELLIEGSTLEERTSLAWSSIPMTFRKCTLDGVGLSGMKLPNVMTVEDSLLDEVDFGRSHFSTVTLRRVRQGEGGIKFNGITAKDILLEEVDLDGLGFMKATAETAIIRNSQILAIGFSGGGVGKINFSNSTIRYFDIAESMIPHVQFTKCKLYEPMLYDGLIKEFVIRESTIIDMKGKNFKADLVLWDNVTLDGKIDLTNAQVKDFRPTRLKRGSKLNLITTGSNMRF
ncbi:MAG: pentapeptide repeat-containing protein [Desulforhopalus sp.]